MKRLVLIALIVMSFGCEDSFPRPSRVDRLRLLAVRADHPRARPGENVSLDALFYDPEGRSLEWAWGTCDAASSSSALECLRATQPDSLQIERDKPAHAIAIPGEPNAPHVIGVVVVVCPGSIERGDTRGIPVACVGEDGRSLALDEFEMGMKRIFVRDEGTNENPAIEHVQFDGQAWREERVPEVEPCDYDGRDITRCKGLRHTIEIAAPDAAETYADETGRRATEQVVVQFYATGGLFEHDVRIASAASTTWAARDDDTGEEITLWIVLRDDRGGVSWVTRRARAGR